MNTVHKAPAVPSRAKLVGTYAAALLLFSVLAGFLVGVARRLFPQLVPLHEPGALDVGTLLNLTVVAAVAVLIYRHLAIRHRARYWEAAIPIAIITGLGSLAGFALLSPTAAKQFFLQLLVVVIAFQMAVAFLASFFRARSASGESPNKSLERTREG